MLTWTDMTENWGYWSKQLQDAYPHLDGSALAFAKNDRTRFEGYLAQTHNLTLAEARDSLLSFMARQRARPAKSHRHRHKATLGV